jgi:predicted choloylglycine hydrolase
MTPHDDHCAADTFQGDWLGLIKNIDPPVSRSTVAELVLLDTDSNLETIEESGNLMM